MVFDEVLLEPEQKELLVKLVEAARNVPRDKRHKFLVAQSFGGDSVLHDGLPGGDMKAYFGDIEILADQRLLLLTYYQPHIAIQFTTQIDSTGPKPIFDITPLRFAYYEQMKISAGEPVRQIETEVRSYLDAQRFRERYPAAYQKWADAEANLWGSDSQRELTTIGHLYREAMQEFATALVERYQPPDVDQDKTHDVNRVRAVVNQHRRQLSDKVHKLLDALVLYWETVSRLGQRQEHGAQKEGEPLVWEDARRLVFQTAVVMFEIDRSLSSLR